MTAESKLNKLAGIAEPTRKTRTKAEDILAQRALRHLLLRPMTAIERRMSNGTHRMKTFALGDRVRWKACSRSRERFGFVVHVVQRGYHPSRAAKRFCNVGLNGYWRWHESYIVEADGRYWWPRVGCMHLIEACAND